MPIQMDQKHILVKNFGKKIININYIGFFSFYFSVSVIRIILAVYLPAYLLNVLNINRGELAFLQIFTYSVMFLAPLLGYFYDRYSRHKKILMFSFSLVLIMSFLILIFSCDSLLIFGLFFGINILSQQIVTVGVSKYVVGLSHNEMIKDNNLTIVNVSANIGSLVPSVIFLVTVQNLYDLNHWSNFFLMGVIFTLPIILMTIFLKDIKQEKTSNNPVPITDKESSHRILYSQIVLIFLSYTVIWSDFLYEYPFSSWIIMKFGESGFNLYSLCFFFFVLLNCMGVIFGKWISKKMNMKLEEIPPEMNKNYLIIKQKKKMIFTTISIYITLTFLMAYSNFSILIICNGIINFVAGIMLLNYVSLMMTITNNYKYKTFAYQVLVLALALSSVIFIPLGTYLSSYISTEFLIIIVGFLSLIALIPLLFVKAQYKTKYF